MHDLPPHNRIYTRLYCKIYNFAIPAIKLPVGGKAAIEPPFILPAQSLRLCKPPMAAFQTIALFDIAGSISKLLQQFLVHNSNKGLV